MSESEGGGIFFSGEVGISVGVLVPPSSLGAYCRGGPCGGCPGPSGCVVMRGVCRPGPPPGVTDGVASRDRR